MCLNRKLLAVRQLLGEYLDAFGSCKKLPKIFLEAEWVRRKFTFRVGSKWTGFWWLTGSELRTWGTDIFKVNMVSFCVLIVYVASVLHENSFFCSGSREKIWSEYCFKQISKELYLFEASRKKHKGIRHRRNRVRCIWTTSLCNISCATVTSYEI